MIKASGQAGHSNNAALVQRAIILMQQEYPRLAGIEDLAQRLAISKCHLVRVFGEEMGLSPGKYLTLVRVDAAKFYLRAREYSIDTVACLCGFAGSNYFCKVFRRAVGISPRTYRMRFEEAVSYEESEEEKKSFL